MTEHTLDREELKRQLLLKKLKAKKSVQKKDVPGERIPRLNRHQAHLSMAQKRMWFLDQLGEQAQFAMHMRSELELNGEFNKKALQQALDALIERHEVLRTQFIDEQGEPLQVIQPTLSFPLTVTDLRNTYDDELDRVIEAQAEQVSVQTFDLETGPLIRGHLLQIRDDEQLLLLSMHHIVSDGWSMGLITSEISALYSAFKRGIANPLPPLSIQYSDYASWQHSQLAGESQQAHLQYWDSQLAGLPEVHNLPCDFPRPARASMRAGSVTSLISSELTQALKVECKTQKMTLFMVLHAALATLMHRLSGESDVVIGTPVANRDHEQTESLIGLFVNTLLLRSQLASTQSIAELWQACRQVSLGAQQHQQVPFDLLVERLNPERSAGHNPLCQVMLVLQNAQSARSSESQDVQMLSADEMAESTSEQDSSGYHATQFDLVLDVSDSDQGLELTWEYAKDLFTADSIQRLDRYFHAIVRAFAADTSQQIHAIALMDAGEQQRLLNDFNATDVKFEPVVAVHHLVEQQAAVSPSALAVDCPEQSLTYAQLNARANQLANWLLVNGVATGSRVAVCTGRHVDLIAAFLGALKAGAAYIPIDPGYPVDRIEHMLQDSQPAVVLLDETTKAKFAERDDTVLIKDAVAQQSTEAPTLSKPLTADDSAYIIYTSGSTGLPKGVVLTHRGLCNLARAQRTLLDITTDSRVLQFAAAGFDACTWEWAMALANGASLILASRSALLPGEPLMQTIQSQGITHVTLPPSAVSQLSDPKALPSLETIVVAGEACAPALAEKWGRHVRFVNGYGPSETTVCATACVYEPGRPFNIGQPIANTRIYVLDEQHQPVPVGARGEIVIAGVGVAKGYLNRAELTEQKFMTDPLFDTDERWYKTGDLGAWQSDGSLMYLGRRDEQIKIRGYRIELGEVENRVRALACVNDALVIASDLHDSSQLVAYLIVDNQSSNDENALTQQQADWRTQLATHLPDYMVPSAFIVLERFPMTPNGKIDRRQLPKPTLQKVTRGSYVAPVGEAENALASVWSSLLSVEPIGRLDRFFDLGGHSLMIMKVIAALRETGWHMEVQDAFEATQLSDLASRLTRADQTAQLAPENRVPEECESLTPAMFPMVSLSDAELRTLETQTIGGAANIQDIYPLSPLQEGILFHHLYHDEVDTYISPRLVAFSSRALLDECLAALQTVTDRHDILRTAIHWQELSDPVQVVHRSVTLPVEEITLNEHEDAQAQMEALMALDQLHVDITQAPIRKILIAKDPLSDQWFLLRKEHHLISDHISFELEEQEIETIIDGDIDDLPAPVQYREFVAHSLALKEDSTADEFFGAMLSDVTEPTAPFDLLDVMGDGQHTEHAEGQLGVSQSEDIRRLCRSLNISPAAFFHLMWAQVIGLCVGRSDVVFGTVVSGRLQGLAGADRMMGMFINTLPLRVNWTDQSLVGALSATSDQLRELIRFEQVPLTRATACAGLDSTTPLFTALINYRYSEVDADEQAVSDEEDDGIDWLESHEHVNYPFTLSIDETGQTFEFSIMVDQSVSAKRILNYLLAVTQSNLNAWQTGNDPILQSLSWLPIEETKEIVHTLSHNPASASRFTSVIEAFEHQVTQVGSTTAVIEGDLSLTYQQLDVRANQTAHWLQTQGVKTGDRVAVHIPRSTNQIVCQLALMKLNAVCLPLDPAQPTGRIQQLLEDSGAQWVLALDDERREAFSTENRHWLNVLTQADDISQSPVERIRENSSLQDPMYVMYTSGTTGTPKGVVVPHRGVLRVALDNGYADLSADDVVIHASNPAFDASTFEVWAALLNGARLVIVDNDTLLNVNQFSQCLQNCHVTVLWMTVGLFNQYAEDLGPAFAQLKYLLVGGDALDPNSVRRVLTNSPPQHFLNAYGPTESTTFACTYPIKEVSEQAVRIPIGRPIAQTRVYVLDKHKRLAPIGVPGELFIGGAGVALGYLNHPELSQDRFIDNPFSIDKDDRLYRTGDLVRWNSEGNLEFLGRNDAQVKLRGFRIELSEIEAQLNSLSAVNESVVMVRTNPTGDEHLVAYVSSDDADRLDLGSLKLALAEQLPAYMIPNAWVRLDRLPLNTNGKVDRKALSAESVEVYGQSNHEQPIGRLEEQLAALWQQLLPVEQVGRHDHFFELGGHSLLAVRLSSKIALHFNRQITLSELFEHPTLEAMAELLETRQPNAKVITPLTERAGLLPVSWSQQRLWFIDQLNQGQSTAYIIPTVVQLEGELDSDALSSSLAALVQRHETLRTRFIGKEGKAYQEIQPAIVPHFRITDLSTQSEAEAETEWEVIHQTELAQPFDLEQGYCFRAHLVQLKTNAWRLMLTMHHIVSDGWSMTILAEELSSLYDAHLNQVPAELPAIPIQYADYAAWQRQSNQGQEDVNYWLEHLNNVPTLLKLPLKQRRPDHPSHEGSRIDIDVPEPLLAQIDQLAQQAGATRFMVFLAAWSIVLSRISGDSDLTIGVPVANRSHPDLESLIGFFVNTLPMRFQVEGDLTCQQWIEQTKRIALAGFEHEGVPFEQLVEAINPPRSLSHHPIFQTLFTMNNTEVEADLDEPTSNETDDNGLSVDDYDGTSDDIQVRYDLSLSLTSESDCVFGSLLFATDIIDETQARSWTQYFLNTLAAFVEQPQADVQSLSVLDAAEQAQLIGSAKLIDAAEYPSFAQQFIEQVRLQPETLAVVTGAQTLTYRQLFDRAASVASWLTHQDDCPYVVLLLDRSIHQVVAVVASLLAGKPFVPIDLNTPRSRLATILEETQTRCLLTVSAQQNLLTDLDLTIGAVDQIPITESQDINAWPLDGELAYVIYTSGSTGRPKGVKVGQANLSHYLTHALNDYAAHPTDASIYLSSYSFDGALPNLLLPLIQGHRICVVDPYNLYADAAYWIQRVDAAFLKMTPSQMRLLLLETPTSEQPHCIVLGGEELTLDLLRDIREHWPKAEIYNQYGPTEITIGCTTMRLTDWYDSIIPIGTPIARTRIMLVNERMQPVPFGSVGEICVMGAGVSQGYVDATSKDQDRFTTSPFHTDNIPMYRTGDFGRWIDNDVLAFEGRRDRQFKLRGYRVELDDIEIQLTLLEGVEAAAVEMNETSSGDQRIIAYVKTALTSETLSQALAEQLPSYMLPNHWVVVDQFALNSSGKINRKQLPAFKASESASRTLPTTDTETWLLAQFETLLDCTGLSTTDSFFSLGGHSLLVVQLVSQIRAHWHRHVSVADVFEQPTIVGLAQRIELASTIAFETIVPADRSQSIPLSWSQYRLWSVHQLSEEASKAYHLPHSVTLTGELDRQALQRALNRVIDRHEVLRTSFELEQEQPVQRVHAAKPLAMIEEDLSLLDEASREHRLEQITLTEEQTPFDLVTGPLIRGQLVRMEPQVHVLLLTLHHIIADGWSLNCLDQELATLYQAFRTNQPDPLPPLVIQYADYAAWQRSDVNRQTVTDQLNYWQDRLADVPTILPLPTDRPRPRQRAYRGRQFGFQFSEQVTNQLRQAGQHYGVTSFTLLQGAWSLLMARLSGQTDVVTGSGVANRTLPQLESMIGFFVNTLAIRTQVDEQLSVRDYLQWVQSNCAADFSHADVPFEQVIEQLNPERLLNVNPLFQVMFTLNNTESMADEDTEVDALEIDHHESQSDEIPTQFDLTVALNDDTEGRIEGSMIYDIELFDGTTIERWAMLFENLVQQLVGSPESLLKDLHWPESFLPEHSINAMPVRSGVQGVIEAFNDVVVAQPDAVAVTEQKRHVSYLELDERSTILANALSARAVCSGDHVAVILPRSTDQIIAQLAVLKIGAIAVPVDPSFPETRLQELLDDCQPSAVIGRVDAAVKVINHPTFMAIESTDRRFSPEHIAQPGYNDAMYIMYTSGSTGKPKGVIAPQAGVLRVAMDNSYAEITADDTVVHASNPAFDASTLEVWGALLNGARLVIVDTKTLLSAQQFRNLLFAEKVTVLWMTVGLFNQYADELGAAFSQLKYLLVGGDALDPVTVGRVLDSHPPQHFLNGYGPTETTTFACTHRIESVGNETIRIPIGRPISATQVYVMDAYQRSVPAGVSGELYIGGAGVALGYLNQPELTEARFINHPLADGERLYRTGDICRWNSEGQLEFLGRNDGQIKIRGFRVELEEIATHVRQCKGVNEAVVIADSIDGQGKRLAAYLSLHPNSSVTVAELQQACRQALPEYMVPQAWVVMERLPLTKNGKVDRKALPEPTEDNLMRADFEAPQTEVEVQVAAIWQQLLFVEKIGRHDHFFELGGHSLLAIQCVTQLNEQGYALSASAVFETPTLSEFSASIQQGAQSDAGLVTLKRGTADKSPLFVVHETSGQVMAYRHLVKAMDNEQTVYGLLFDWSEEDSIIKSIEALAQQHVRTIKKKQPQGPYRLLGWSAGGDIAFEVASQLLGAGESVDYLGLIDSRLDNKSTHDKASAIDFLFERDEARTFGIKASLKPLYQQLNLAGDERLISESTFASLQANRKVQKLFDECQAGGFQIEDYIHHLNTSYQLYRAHSRYFPQKTAVEVQLFAATETNDDDLQYDLKSSWESVCQRLFFNTIHGSDHDSIMYESVFVERVAKTIQRRLQQLEEATPITKTDEHHPLVTIQQGCADSIPMFCIPGAGATITCFISLSQAFDTDQTIYGLQPRGIDGASTPYPTVESAAEHYVEHILTKTVTSKRCTLVGHSFGSWVALEVAHRLKQHGIDVEQLVLLDSAPPTIKELQSRNINRTEALMRLVKLFECQTNRTIDVSYARLDALTEADQLQLLLELMKASDLVPPQTNLHAIKGMVRSYVANLTTHFRPASVYSGSVVLVAAKENNSNIEKLKEDWREFVECFDFLEVGGNHMTMLSNPHITDLMKKIQMLCK